MAARPRWLGLRRLPRTVDPGHPRAPCRRDASAEAMSRQRLRRSELSTPATNVKMIAKAATTDADLVFLDLEDAVAPAHKVGARKNVIAALNDLDWGSTARSYRINGIHTPWCHDDLIEVVAGAGSNIDVVIVPKVKSAREVWFVDDLLTQLERKLGLEEGRIGLEGLVGGGGG